MKPVAAAAVALLACLAGALPAHALSFAEAYDAAIGHDAPYRAAGHERQAAQEAVPVARASLLPQANLSVSRSSVSGDREFQNSLNQTVRTPVEYESPQAALQMRMPLFNDELLARLGQAQAQADGADAALRMRRLEMIERLGAAYLGVLLAQDNLRLAQQQVGLTERQVQRSERRLAQGEGTRVDVVQARASLELARSRVTEARDRVSVAQRDLQRVTGVPSATLAATLEDYRATPLDSDSLIDWIERARRDNPMIEVRQQQIESARFNVRRSRAGHLPRVDLVASVSHSSNESITSLNQKSQTQSLGVQLNVPLFAGGGVEASVRQARADQSRLEEELRATTEAIELEVQRQFLAARSLAERIEVQGTVVAAADVALHAANRSVDAGLGTVANVIEAQAQRFAVLRDLAQVRQEYLLARLRLLTQAGSSAENVVQDLHRQLQSSTVAQALPVSDKPSAQP